MKGGVTNSGSQRLKEGILLHLVVDSTSVADLLVAYQYPLLCVAVLIIYPSLNHISRRVNALYLHHIWYKPL